MKTDASFIRSSVLSGPKDDVEVALLALVVIAKELDVIDVAGDHVFDSEFLHRGNRSRQELVERDLLLRTGLLEERPNTALLVLDRLWQVSFQ
jgi:hypothetical protein